MIVLDACAAVEITRQTEVGLALQRVFDGSEKVISCELFRAEVSSVFRKLARTEGLSVEDAELRSSRAFGLIDEWTSLEELQGEALSESIRLDHSTYDMFYFVLARRTRATLFTLDKKLVRLCEKHGVSCVTLVDY